MEYGTQFAKIKKCGLTPREGCQKSKGWFILTLICAESFSSQMLLSSSGKHSNVDYRLSLSQRPLCNEVAERRNATRFYATMKVVTSKTQQNFTLRFLLGMGKKQRLHQMFSCIRRSISGVWIGAKDFNLQGV